MKLNSLEDLFTQKLNEIYSAEKLTSDVLPKMAEVCSDQEVKHTFMQHIDQSKEQLSRLHQAFSKLGQRPHAIKNPIVEAMIGKGTEIMNSKGDPDVKNAALIAVEQDIEHYEIASYGTARSYARALKKNDIADLLEATLKEEGYTDKKLSRLADKGTNGGAGINRKAA